ncbi:MAG: hypothetical protein HY657_01715 [Acidobacteria bacterium]|nr:hypothetical protein [Acidobacteriota bacterium]
MTPGTRVAELAARILRAETFTLIVSPAVADLQIEAPTAGWPQRLRGHVAVWRAFCGALWYDLGTT